jgi:hypothetical protein
MIVPEVTALTLSMQVTEPRSAGKLKTRLMRPPALHHASNTGVFNAVRHQQTFVRW